MAGQFSPQEQTYYNRLFDVVDKEKLGVLPGDASITFLLTSSLPQRTLGEIWALCDPNNTGYLTRDGWWKACRLIGWAQKGETVREELMTKPGALPKFEGHELPSIPPLTSTITPQLTGAGMTAHPALTAADKNQYTRLFVSSNPVNGLLPATQAQTIFLKSGLPTETLAQIWNLADTQQRGSLDLPDFILAMYFIQHSMAGTFKTLPMVLPAGLYEQASGGRPKPPPLPTSPIVRQMTGNMGPNGSPTPSIMARQMTGSAPIQPQRTGQSYTSPTGIPPQRQFSGSTFMPPPAQQAWDIKPEEKQAADSFFDGLDTARRGFIEGDVAVPFMFQSGLPEGTLAQIWDLADIRKEGKLNKDEFAVAMYLINKKLGGIEVPATLPNSLIPPSLRSGVDNQQQSQTQRDLFDLFADSPPASAGPTQQAQTQTNSYFSSSLAANAPGQGQRPQRAHLPGGTESFGPSTFGTDLMGDDEAPSPATPQPQPKVAPARSLAAIQPQVTGPKAPTRDYSADIGNAKNSLDSTTRSIDGLQKEKAELEQKESSAAAELKEIELRLSSVRAQHDNETRIVEDLKRRTAEQTETLNKLRSDLIANESELSALRAEKDETEQTLLRDKEEVRSMGKRMKEVQEETDKLKSLLEKMKKEARQQRGMVAIAKKQVQTVEGTRDAVQKEMDDVAAGKGMEPTEQTHDLDAAARIISPQPTGVASPGHVTTAASIPLPATPQRAVSPVATGNTSRSNNPFDRLGFGGSSFAKAPSSNNGAQPFPSAFAQTTEQTPPVHQASRDLQSATAEKPQDDSSLSTLQKATMGVGAVAAAGALAVGSVAEAAVAGVHSAFGTGEKTAADDEHTDNGADTMHEIAQHVKEETTPQHSDPGSPGVEVHRDATNDLGDHDVSGSSLETPADEQAKDPFGMSSQPELERQNGDLTPTAETPSAQPGTATEDPFGMPPSASAGGFVTAKDHKTQSDFDGNFESNFDEGFGDDFGKAPGDAGDFGRVTSPTEDMHLAPASEPKRDLDTGDVKPASAVPTQLRGLVAPSMPERTASTQAVAPSSSVGTPFSEYAPSTPRSMETQEPVPVDVAAMAPVPASSTDQDDDDRVLSAGTSSAPRSVEPESSDDEDDGPEDLEHSRSAFSAQHTDQLIQSTGDTTTPSHQENPVPSLANLGLGAPLAEDHEQSFGSAESAPAGHSSFAPMFGQEKRRDPPPPPPTRSSASAQGNNPFASFVAASTPTPTSAMDASASSAQPKQAPSASSFDDDFDFENLPSAQVSHDQTIAQTQQPSTDFDDEFDDFSNDFEVVPPATHQPPAQGSSVAAPSGAPQLPGFDDNFGLSKPIAPPAQPLANNADRGSGFDDNFGSSFTPAPQVASQQGLYAPPPGPPPAQTQGGRPDLPARQSANRAQPDDLDDVKKLCNMGFDRSLVVEALEANGYDFSKTLNVLLT